jgi:AcrR family transcriptional regulator
LSINDYNYENFVIEMPQKKNDKGYKVARPKKDTAKRILDMAEQLFAERGYDASSMSEIASLVGIQTPSLYNHYASKQTLYEAVIESRLQPLFELLESVNVLPDTAAGSLHLLRAVARHYIEHPDLARLVQHAALAGGQQLEVLQQRCYRPLAKLFREHMNDNNLLLGAMGDEKLIFLIINFHSMIFGYVTMAPVYAELLGEDLMLPHSVDKQLQALEEMASKVWD